MKHLLVVDDDRSFRSFLIDYLSQHAFRVTGVPDSYHLNKVMSSDPVDLFIVDLNLGHEDGLEIVRSLSAKSEAPIIVITGDRFDEADKVVGLELGASDYLVKPFGLREFLARVRVALRPRSTPSNRRNRKTYTFGNWSLSVHKRAVSRDGEEIKLTKGEFNLLTVFLDAPSQILSREQLLLATRIHEDEIFDRSIDVLVLRLRRKLEADPSRPSLIVTERGAGYIFNAEVSVEERPRRRSANLN